ncbi:MAG TPA: hypothetical protein VEU30_07155 [Thermoanaerobaculia bacterium]|nr:hypothetical protein [Thermoanaerobaculia bacterium]
MAWTVLFWNIQGAAKQNRKLEKILEVVALVKPDLIGFSEVGLKFPYEEFTGYSFQEQIIVDRNDKDTPKGLAVGIKKEKLEFESELGPLQKNLFTSQNPVVLTRPILKVWVSGVEVVIAHAPSTGGGLGKSTVGNIFDYFRDQCRLSKGVYKGFAVGDFNAAFSPYKIAIEETYEDIDIPRKMKTKSVYYYMIQLCDPGWDITQKSGGVLDYMITCGVFGIADKTHHHTIKSLNESRYLSTWPSTPKLSVPKSELAIETVDPSLDSVYGLVKGSLDSLFSIQLGEKEDILGWFVDHRPVIYEIMNAERGPLAPRLFTSHLL